MMRKIKKSKSYLSMENLMMDDSDQNDSMEESIDEEEKVK